jgi:hypothetical protein
MVRRAIFTRRGAFQTARFPSAVCKPPLLVPFQAATLRNGGQTVPAPCCLSKRGARNREDQPAAVSFRNRAGVRFPNIAVPTLTSVAPSSIATGKSSLIPMERCVNLT